MSKLALERKPRYETELRFEWLFRPVLLIWLLLGEVVGVAGLTAGHDARRSSVYRAHQDVT